MKTSCKFYSFLRAVRGNWRNAIFVSCGCDACMYGREKPCSGFLLTVDERGQVMLLATETIRELTGEEVEPAECSAVLSRRSFDASWTGISSMVYKLRRKLGADIIETVRGHGYRMRITK